MILLELIPRSIESLLDEALTLKERFPFIDAINIPDVKRLPIRSHDASIALQHLGIDAIPHIRCMDRTLHDTVILATELAKNGIKRVLIISGDTPKSGPIHPVSPVDVIAAIKDSVPDLKVFAGTDPYRSHFQREITYCQQKRQAGADGFFSQPFFNASFAAYYRSLIGEVDFFTGISPVLSVANRTYWETVNQVVFPADFELNLDYNARLATALIQGATDEGQHTYLMPIKADPAAYLSAIATIRSPNHPEQTPIDPIIAFH